MMVCTISNSGKVALRTLAVHTLFGRSVHIEPGLSLEANHKFYLSSSINEIVDVFKKKDIIISDF